MKQLTIITLLIISCIMPATARDYVITDFGATTDTAQLSTKAVQQAIDLCHKDGGGRVVVPNGAYTIGTIILRSNVTIYLENGATLYGSTQLSEYKKLKPEYLSLRTQKETIQLIYAEKAHNITITGQGTIDGQGKGFRKLTWDDEGITRPHLLRLIECEDVNVSGITLKNSACWMQHYLACDRVRLSDLHIINRNNYNNDAIDIDGCHDVIIKGIFADSDDDAITLKSTSPRKCEDVTISDCVVSSHCNAIKLGTETNGGFKNINIHGIVVKPSADQSTQFFGERRGICAIALEIVDGGEMDNVIVSGITVRGTESPIFIRLANRARGYYEGQRINNIGKLHDIMLSDINVTEAGPYGCSITGMSGHRVENITLRNIRIRHEGGGKPKKSVPDEKEDEYPEATMWGHLPAKGFYLRHTRNIKMENIEISTTKADSRPDIVGWK